MSYPGKMIVIEGLEGAGKSTAVESIAERLKESHIDFLLVREPGGTEIGEKLRALLKNPDYKSIMSARSELLLIYAARIQLLEEKILPALEAGLWVLADRFELSSFAYQGGGRALDKTFIEALSAFSLRGFQPDLTFYLDISPESGMARAKQRGAYDRIEQEPMSFFKKIRESYLENIQAIPHLAIINAEEDRHSVQNNIIKVIDQMIADYAK